MILLIAIVSALIVISPMAAAENNVMSDYVVFGFNPFGNSNDVPFEIKDLKIVKVNREHTESNGNVKKSTNYYLKFNVTSDSEFEKFDVKIDCLDKDNKSIKTVKSYIDHDGTYNVKLKDVSGIKGAKLIVVNGNGDELLNQFTSKIKVSKKVTKDKAEEQTSPSSSSSSSSSSQTYWASSNSNKFHYPSCEWAQKISGKNKVVFSSRDEAINSGYQPCQVCSP